MFGAIDPLGISRDADNYSSKIESSPVSLICCPVINGAVLPADRTSVVLMYSGAGEDLKVRDTVCTIKKSALLTTVSLIVIIRRTELLEIPEVQTEA